MIPGDSSHLATIPDTPAPSEEPARQLIEEWLQATRAGDLMTALRLTTRDSNPALLRNLDYEIAYARRSSPPTTITGIHGSGSWTTVTTRTHLDGKPSFPMYPIIPPPPARASFSKSTSAPPPPAAATSSTRPHWSACTSRVRPSQSP